MNDQVIAKSTEAPHADGGSWGGKPTTRRGAYVEVTDPPSTSESDDDKELDSSSRMGFSEWMKTYKPVMASWDQLRLYDPENPEDMKIIQQTPTAKLWTLTDCDNEQFVQVGFHFVNRLGYYITEIEWIDKELQIYDDDDFQPDSGAYANL
jgi:hypothetical protein